MEKAIVFTVICIFALIGIKNSVEFLSGLFEVKQNRTAVLLFNPGRDAENIEMTVRSLAADAFRVKTAEKIAVYIVNDTLSPENDEICKKTAQQLCNVFVGSIEGAYELLGE